ncbi:MAG: CAP domain-containing protein [Patescibacteria group bacterium]|nr:CAP domain-containing protein [Patescibacteria group bacterium]
MDKNKKTNKSWLKFLFLGGFLLFLFKKEEKKGNISLKDLEHNFLDFAKKEGKEVNELIHHKEDIEEYIEDSESIFRDYFIPHNGNNHHPKILRKKPLFIVLFLALMLKISLISYLFFIYPNDGRMSEDIQLGVFNMLNEERVANGLEPLELNQSLLASAMDKVDDMITNDYFAHESLDGRMPWDFVSRRDYPYLYIGENLGMSFSSSESVHNALMNSPSHKKNILNEKYTDIGVVVKRGVIDGKETNILVQLFGTEKEVELIPNPVVALAIIEKTEVAQEIEKIEVLAEEVKAEPEPEPVEEIVEKIEPEVKEAVNDKPEEKTIIISKEEIDALKLKIELENNKNNNIISSTSPLMLGDNAKQYIEKKTPEPNLELDLSDIKFVANTNSDDKYTVAARMSDYLNVLLIGVLALMSFAMFLNIFVRFRVQHKPVLVQTFLLLVLLFGIYSTKLHFLEKLPGYITIF